MGLTTVSSAAVGQNTFATGRQKIKQRPAAQHHSLPPIMVRAEQPQPAPKKASVFRQTLNKFNPQASEAPKPKAEPILDSFDEIVSKEDLDTLSNQASDIAKALKNKYVDQAVIDEKLTKLTDEIYKKIPKEPVVTAAKSYLENGVEIYEQAANIALNMVNKMAKASNPLEAAKIWFKSGVELNGTAVKAWVKNMNTTLELAKKLVNNPEAPKDDAPKGE